MWWLIGIVPWLIVIWLTIPESITMTLIILLVAGLLFAVYVFIMNRINRSEENQYPEESEYKDRQKAIEEWERKWKRKHPSRDINH